MGSIPGSGRFPWRREWQLTPVFLLGKFHRQRSLEGYSPWSEVAQSCPTLCDPMDSSPPGSTVHGIFQARILEWATISFSRGSSQPRDQTQVSSLQTDTFTVWTTREAHSPWGNEKSAMTEHIDTRTKAVVLLLLFFKACLWEIRKNTYWLTCGFWMSNTRTFVIEDNWS